MLINVPVNPIGLLNYVAFISNCVAIVYTEGSEMYSAMDLHSSVEISGFECYLYSSTLYCLWMDILV